MACIKKENKKKNEYYDITKVTVLVINKFRKCDFDPYFLSSTVQCALHPPFVWP